jgi:dTDP-4-amino-4,6-dideoxygalactose transaminase
MAVSNCTAGLHLALLGLGVQPRDEVIVADYTYPATGHAVMFCGATPRFADVRPDIWTIDVDAAAALVNERTVGIIAVDAIGQCADYTELAALCRAKGLFLLEDAACSAGATYQGHPAGSPALADAAAFSLHGRKGITSGEGGVVTTADDDIAKFVSTRLCFGVEPALSRAGSFDHLGWNYKMSDIASAIAEVQLDRIQSFLERRREIAAQYEAALAHAADLVATPVTLHDRDHTWQSYVVTLATDVPRGPVAVALRAGGIGCNIGTFACHLQPIYESGDSCPHSADAFRRHLAIPMHANLTDGEVAAVADALVSAAMAARSSA